MNTGMKTITATDARRLLADGQAMLIDVRDPSEFAGEHIACAASMPLSTLDSSALDALPADRKMIFQCQRGKRGEQACAVIDASSLKQQVFNLEGGIEAWKAAGLPVVRQQAGMPIQRQVQLTIGLLVLISVVLGFSVNTSFFLLAGFLGMGLTFAGLTGWCGLALLMKQAPWNAA
jgi:rhodanese-related sulfurtransferase